MFWISIKVRSSNVWVTVLYCFIGCKIDRKRISVVINLLIGFFIIKIGCLLLLIKFFVFMFIGAY